MSRYSYVEAVKRKVTMRKKEKKDNVREVKLPDPADYFHRRAN